MKWALTKERKLQLRFEGPMSGYQLPEHYPNISVVYVYPMVPDQIVMARAYAQRFASCYRAHPPLLNHECVVVLNGGKPTPEVRTLFSPLHNLRFIEHDDSGWDIGAFQKAARQLTSELIVFFGTSIYMNYDGWLERMVEAYQKKGRALYGAHGNRGAKLMPRYPDVYPHVRTTGFWMERELFNLYPMKITIHQQRYLFEHGRNCLTSWVTQQGYKTYVVTWNGEYEWRDWDQPNAYQSGDQSQLLVGDRLTEAPFYTLKARIPEKNSNILPRAVSPRPAAQVAG